MMHCRSHHVAVSIKIAQSTRSGRRIPYVQNEAHVIFPLAEMTSGNGWQRTKYLFGFLYLYRPRRCFSSFFLNAHSSCCEFLWLLKAVHQLLQTDGLSDGIGVALVERYPYSLPTSLWRDQLLPRGPVALRQWSSIVDDPPKKVSLDSGQDSFNVVAFDPGIEVLFVLISATPPIDATQRGRASVSTCSVLQYFFFPQFLV